MTIYLHIRKFIIFALLLVSNFLIAQSSYDLRITLDSLNCQNKTACFNVQLRNVDTTAWGLAGQNYRLYYDASLAAYQSGISTLPNNYQAYTLIQDIQDVDASATNSNLNFEGTLGFLNYTMDLANISTGGITLPADSSWVTTTQLCFALEDDLLNDPSSCLEMVWAEDGQTNDYATSFVEISEWVQADSTEMANGQNYDGLDATDGDSSCFANSCRYDYGDLQDRSNGTASGDYQTLAVNNGPSHLIIEGLSLGNSVDNELDGQPSDEADGDGVDENGLTIFPSLDLGPSIRVKIPFSYINTTNQTAYLEGWIDWNNDGDFDVVTELVVDANDALAPFPNYIQAMIPSTVALDSNLGLRLRISLQDNMTPYGVIESGEVEDYLLPINCKNVCLPIIFEVKDEN